MDTDVPPVALPHVPSLPAEPPDCLLAWIDRHRIALFFALACCCLLAFSGRWRLGPDSTLYVSLAHSLAAGHGYHAVGWPRGNSHVGLPLMLSVSFRTLSPDALWPLISLIFLMGAAAVAAVYCLLRSALPRPAAVAATLLTAASFTFTEYLYELLNAVPSFLGMMVAMAAFEALTADRPRPLPISRRLLWIAALLAGLAFAASLRPVTWALMLAMAAVAAGRAIRHPRLRRSALLLLPVIAAGLALSYLFDPRHGHMTESHEAWLHRVLLEQPLHTLHTAWTVTLPQILGPITVRAFFTFSLGRILSIPVALALLALTLRAARRRPLWILWVAGTLLMLLVYPEPQTRYYLPILPFMALGILDAALWLGRKVPRAPAAAMAGLLLLWLAPSLARLARLACLQHAPDFLAHVINGRYVPFRQMDALIQTQLPPRAVVLSSEALALEALAPDQHLSQRFMMPMIIPPPDLRPELPALLADHHLFAVDAGDHALDRTLDILHLAYGPPLAAVERDPWEYPPAPGRWLHPAPVPIPPPLTLRALLPAPPNGKTRP